MSWSTGFDTTWQRDIGYGVPAWCDAPDCGTKIDRGLYYVCGGAVYGGDAGCGLFFCDRHLAFAVINGEGSPQLCDRCIERLAEPDRQVEPFAPTPDHPEWIRWKLTDSSWDRWRREHPALVGQLRAQLPAAEPVVDGQNSCAQA